MRVTISLILLWVVYTPILANTYYISLSGNNSNSGLSESNAWRTITYAASAASPVGPGDIVYVKAGDYGNEQAVFETDGSEDAPIKFIGYQNTPGDDPNLNFSYGDLLNSSIMPLLHGASRSSGYGMLLHGRSYVEVSNFQITNYIGAIHAYGSNELRIKNIIALEFGDKNASYSGRAIAIGSSAYNSIIEDCFIMNGCAEGLSVTGDGHIIRNVTVYADDNSTGIHSAQDYYIIVAGNNNLIENSYVERVGDLDHGGHGITLKGDCVNNIIRNCISKNMGYANYQLRHRGCTDNLIENCLSIGSAIIVRDGASDNIIRNCITDGSYAGVGFLDTTEDGGAQYTGRNNIFENCVFQNTTNFVIDFAPYSEVSLADQNTFINCVFDGGPQLFRSSRPNNNNKMINCTVTNVQSYGSVANYPIDFDFEYTCFYNNGFTTPPGNNVFTADPQFQDIDNNDYHLTVNSPLIDTGTSMNAPLLDFDGNVRPVNGIVDIGIYEYGGIIAPNNDADSDGIIDAQDPDTNDPCNDPNNASYNPPATADCDNDGVPASTDLDDFSSCVDGTGLISSCLCPSSTGELYYSNVTTFGGNQDATNTPVYYVNDDVITAGGEHADKALPGDPVIIQMELLGGVQSLEYLSIDWFVDFRTEDFSIESSMDGISYTPVSDTNGNGAGNYTSAASAGFQDFIFNPVNAQFVRLIGYSNSAGTEWINIAEIDMYGTCLNPCASPSNLSLVAQSASSLTVTWTESNNALSYNLRYREASVGGAWTDISIANTVAILTGLNDCTDYEVEVRSECQLNLQSTYSATEIYSTTNCFTCTAPSNLYQFNIQNNSVIITWDVLVGVTSYTYKFRKVGDPSWISYSTSFPLAVLFGISTCTDYEWTMETTCPDGSVVTSSSTNYFTTLCKSEESNNSSTLNTNEILKAYPNPAHSSVSILVPDNIQRLTNSVKVYDMTGTLKLHTEIDTEENIVKLNVQSLVQGVYLLQVDELSTYFIKE